MSDVTVGPIQTYSDDSLLSSSTTTSEPVVANNVSVTLTESDLWLVDTSKLNAQTESTTSSTAFLTLDPAVQDTTTFDNVTMTASSPFADSALESTSSNLQTNIPEGGALTLTQVTGGTQLSSDSISTSSTSSSGGSTGESGGGGSGSLSGGGDSSGSGVGASGGGSGTSSSSNTSNTGQSPDIAQTATASTTQTPTSPQASASPQVPVPVPFDMSPTLGLLLISVIFGYKLLLRKIAFKAAEIKQLDCKNWVS